MFVTYVYCIVLMCVVLYIDVVDVWKCICIIFVKGCMCIVCSVFKSHLYLYWWSCVVSCSDCVMLCCIGIVLYVYCTCAVLCRIVCVLFCIVLFCLVFVLWLCCLEFTFSLNCTVLFRMCIVLCCCVL